MAEKRYSFDVPDTVVNFKDMDEDELTRVDTWFDGGALLLNTPSGEVAAGLMQKAPVSRANLPCAIVSPMVKSNENHSDAKETVVAGRVPPNVISSLAEWHGTLHEASAAPAKTPGRVAKRRSARIKSAQRRLVAKSQAEKSAATLAGKEEVPPTKKRKMSNNREKLGELDLNVSPVRTTAPATPKARNPPSKMKSTEQLELERMQQMQREVAELRKKNEESCKAALAGPGQQQRLATHTTKPVDFHFSTDERLKLRGGESQPATEYKEVDFTAALRKCPPSPARGPKGPTVPKPFNLSQGSKRKHEEAVSEYVSFAQQVENFQRRTPSRYHLRSRREEEGRPQNRPLKAGLTHPRTPHLETKGRLRPVICKSAAELEAEEVARLQQYKFKAQEVNLRILEGGPVLPKKPPVKEPTKPIGFDLEIEKRIRERESKKPEEEEEHYEFRSRPCPMKILEDVVGVPEKRPLPITIPKSPAFSLKNKVGTLAREQEKEKEEAIPGIKAKPMPHFGVPFKPKAAEPRQVELCPFSFDARDRERLLQKERKMEELQKEEVPKFKAQPVPQFDHVDLPEKKVKCPTKPAPFQLEIDKRGETRHELWRQQLQEQLRQQKEAASFKAQPSHVVHQVPFVPKKDSKPLSVPENFELATERRARERKEFEMRLAELEAEKARLQEAARRDEEERERERLARLREELVHRANPIRKYQAVEVKPSDQPLTVPQSPNFSDRFHC